MFDFRELLLTQLYFKNKVLKKPRVFVCGASGLLGGDLCTYFQNHGIDYQGTYYRHPAPNLIQVDFNKSEDIEQAMKSFETTVCVNCVVERMVNVCEEDWQTTKSVNIDLPNRIARVCQKLGIHLIHISTDYVFDGKSPPYLPSSSTNPLQNYGISKLISENRVFASCKTTTVIRVSVLYTENVRNLEDNAVTLIGKKVLNRIEPSKEDNYSVRRPNYIPDFCHFIGDMVKNPKSGTFHYYNPHVATTKYQTAEYISEFLHKPMVNHIQPIERCDVPIEDVERPLDTQLIDNQYKINKYPFTPFIECIQRCFSGLYHPPLYLNQPPKKDIFFLLDLDGTLVDTDKLHFIAYHEALSTIIQYNLNYDTYEQAIQRGGMDKFLKENLLVCDAVKAQIKRRKTEYMLNNDEPVLLMKNAEKLIEYIHKYNIGHAVVTNTSKAVVESFKTRNPRLNSLENWVTREDYGAPKPDSECYKLALQKFGKNETHIIGIENTVLGYQSLSGVTKCIYIVTEKGAMFYDHFKRMDAYLINDFEQVFDK
jgi:dTDP-4-dehydrorhamnose reductase